MTLRDISIALAPGTPEWPGDTPYSCGWTWRIADGASVNLSAFTTSPHCGTHADAPLHVSDGWAAADAMPLDAFAGAARVLTIERRAAHARTARPRGAGRRAGRAVAAAHELLDRRRHLPRGVAGALASAAIESLVSRGLKLLGVDAPSVDERESKTLPAHRALFAGGAYILENLDLRGAADGMYELLALPVKLAGLDAAPVRAALETTLLIPDP